MRASCAASFEKLEMRFFVLVLFIHWSQAAHPRKRAFPDFCSRCRGGVLAVLGTLEHGHSWHELGRHGENAYGCLQDLRVSNPAWSTPTNRGLCDSNRSQSDGRCLPCHVCHLGSRSVIMALSLIWLLRRRTHERRQVMIVLTTRGAQYG